jgi:hypothetical protein
MGVTAVTFFLPAQVLDGWVVDVYGRKVLWIPAHLRSDNPAALYHATVVWFDSRHFPIIVHGHDLSWWSLAGVV